MASKEVVVVAVLVVIATCVMTWGTPIRIREHANPFGRGVGGNVDRGGGLLPPLKPGQIMQNGVIIQQNGGRGLTSQQTPSKPADTSGGAGRGADLSPAAARGAGDTPGGPGARAPPAAARGTPGGLSRGEKWGLGLGVFGLLASAVIGALGFVLKPTYMKDPKGTPVDANGNLVPWSDLPMGDKILSWLQQNAALFSGALWSCVLCCCCCCCLCIMLMAMGSSKNNNGLTV